MLTCREAHNCSPMPPLPPELTDQIIASVATVGPYYTDYRTLRNCALVCRDWLPASRLQLFKLVSIDSEWNYTSFVENVLHTPALRGYLNSIEQVVLVDGEPLILSLSHAPVGDRQRVWAHRFIYDFAGNLPRLEALTLEQVEWIKSPPHPTAHLATSRFSSVRRLTLINCMLPSTQMLRRMVSALSASLIYLRLSNVRSPPARGGASATYTYSTPGPALQTLHLECVAPDVHDNTDCIPPLVGWLAHTSTLNSLRELSLQHVASGNDLSPVHDIDCIHFFKLVAPALVTLRLIFDGTYYNTESLVCAPHKLTASIASLGVLLPDSENLRSLQHLTVGFSMSLVERWHFASLLLLALPPESRIRHLCFELWLEERHILRADRGDSDQHQTFSIPHNVLDSVESILQAQQFASLDHVEFRLAVLPMQHAAEDMALMVAEMLKELHRKLPSVARRGILSARWV